MQLIKNTKIDFISKARITIFLSIGIILAGIISLIINGGPNLSIDFKGGTVFQVSTQESININELRKKLASTNLANSEITEITGLNVNQEFRIKANIDNTTNTSDIILNVLDDRIYRPLPITAVLILVPANSCAIPANIVSTVTAVSASNGVGAGLTAFILALTDTSS